MKKKIFVLVSFVILTFLIYSQDSLYTDESFGKVQKEALLLKIKTVKDDMTDMTYYISNKTSLSPNKISFHVYIGHKIDQPPVLRLVIQYFGTDWLFIRGYLFKTDDKTSKLVPTEDLSTKVLGGGNVKEVYDEVITFNSLNIILDILNAKQETKMRFMGKEGVYDFKIKDGLKKSLIDVLDLYVVLGGVFPNQ